MVSVIIPTLNEQQVLPETLRHLAANRTPHEVIVCDAGSSDGTVGVAEAAGARVVRSPRRQRAAQMNLGAECARGEALLFLHADTRVPADGLAAIERTLRSPEVAGGGFARRFDGGSLFLRATCAIADVRCRVSGLFLGDQAIFIRTDVFRSLVGFRELDLFEDVDLCRRMRRVGRVLLLTPPVVSSSRRFRRRGPVATTFSDLILSLRYISGADPNRIARELRGG